MAGPRTRRRVPGRRWHVRASWAARQRHLRGPARRAWPAGRPASWRLRGVRTARAGAGSASPTDEEGHPWLPRDLAHRRSRRRCRCAGRATRGRDEPPAGGGLVDAWDATARPGLASQGAPAISARLLPSTHRTRSKTRPSRPPWSGASWSAGCTSVNWSRPSPTDHRGRRECPRWRGECRRDRCRRPRSRSWIYPGSRR